VQAYVFLSLYWVAPWIITRQDVQAPAWLLGAAVFTFGVGVFLHFVADMQKWVALQLRPGLITTGVWARSRNPNYLGELLIYGSFAALSLHWAPWVILAFFFLTTWLPRMRKKDQSLSRYPEFAAYKAHSGLMLPALVQRRTETPPVTAGS
jgi:steroid 5-alpha reductase family enzyme